MTFGTKALPYRVLNEQESFAALVERMPLEHRRAYEEYGHRRAEPVFIERLLFVYQCQGRGRDGQQLPPDFKARLRVINFRYSLDTGFLVDILNEEANQKQAISVVPERLFDYPIYASTPCSFTLRHNLVEMLDGRPARFDASAVLYIKTRNKADFYSKGNFYIETPNRMYELYPGIALNLK